MKNCHSSEYFYNEWMLLSASVVNLFNGEQTLAMNLVIIKWGV